MSLASVTKSSLILMELGWTHCLQHKNYKETCFVVKVTLKCAVINGTIIKGGDSLQAT